MSASVFFCFELWDYLPTILLVLTVTSRPVGNRPPTLGAAGGEAQSLLTVYRGYGGEEEGAAGVEMAALAGGQHR